MTDGYAVVHLRLTKGTAPGSFPEPPRSGVPVSVQAAGTTLWLSRNMLAGS